MEVLHIFHRLSYYPGHDIINDLIDRFHAMASIIGLVNPNHLSNVTYGLFWAVEQHGYIPPPALASMVLEWCRNTRITSGSDVSGVAVVVEKLYESFLAKAPPQAYPSQAAVDALLQHIGDPDKLVERICPEMARQVSPKLKAAVDLLKRNKPMTTPIPPQGGDRGAEDGHKKAEQLEGKGAQRGGRHDEARMETLWIRVRDAQMGQRAGQALDQPSPVTHALSTTELSMLLEAMACGGIETAVKGRYRAGAVCLRAMVREGVRPGRLEAMDNSTLRAWVRCLRRTRGTPMDVQERRAMLDVWEEEVNRRGVLQVATTPQELVSLLASLSQMRLEVDEALVSSIFAEVQRRGLQSFTPQEVGILLTSTADLPGLQECMKQLEATPPSDLDAQRLLAIFSCVHKYSMPLSDTYLEQLRAALKAEGLSKIPLQQLVVGVRQLSRASGMPFQPLLHALDRVVNQGQPDGILAPLPEDEGEREALREWVLHGLTMMICSKSEGQCDLDVQERGLRAYLSAAEGDWASAVPRTGH
jgi:hypothetical protein